MPRKPAPSQAWLRGGWCLLRIALINAPRPDHTNSLTHPPLYPFHQNLSVSRTLLSRLCCRKVRGPLWISKRASTLLYPTLKVPRSRVTGQAREVGRYCGEKDRYLFEMTCSE
eukprot:jgi/Botrbrau1/19697/Bobra.0003s0058.1